MSKRLIAAVCVLICVLLAGSGPAGAETQPGDQLPLLNPACGSTLTKSFRLSADRHCDFGHGWFVGKDGLTIDLNGHVLSGGFEDYGISNGGGHKQTLVRNGAVRAFQYGLRLGPDSSVFNVVVVDHEYGIEGSKGLSVQNSSIVANSVGFQGVAATGMKLLMNRFSANDDAIVLDDGEVPPDSPTATVIRKNVIAGNFERGIDVRNGSGHLIEENRVVGNGHSGTGFPGIQIGTDATGIKTLANEINANGDDGYRDDGSNNTASKNEAKGNGFWIANGIGTGIEAGTNPSGSKNDSLGNDATTQCTTASMCALPAQFIKLPVQTPACGSTITKSFALGANVTCPSGPWITITASNVTVDLNRKTVRDSTIATDSTLTTRGVVSTAKNTIVRNGVIRDFNVHGILVDDGSPLEKRGFQARDLVLANNHHGIRTEEPGGADGVIERIVVVGTPALGVCTLAGQSVRRSTLAGNEYNLVTGSDAPTKITENLFAAGRYAGANVEPVPGSVFASNVLLGNGHGWGDGVARPNLRITVALGIHAGIEATGNVIEGGGGDGILDEIDEYNNGGARLASNRIRANGYLDGNSDNAGLGIDASVDPEIHGSGNRAMGNDDRAECDPAFLC